MGMKSSVIVAVVAGVVLVGGGVAAATAIGSADSAPEPTASVTAPASDSTETPSPTPSATPDLSDKTAPGEVCDPHNLNDTICAAFYPDMVVLNMTSAPRAGEPLTSLPDAQRIALAHQACDQLAAGANLHSVSVIETTADAAAPGLDNNFSLASAGSLAYCHDFIDSSDVKWTLEQYISMGEDAAKASFAGGQVIHR